MEKVDQGRETMLKFLEQLPQQIEEASGWDYGFADRMRGEINEIVVAGMGGSAIGGDILRTYCLDRSRCPVTVLRDYRLPRFVGKDSLLIAVSYSGNTEETLAVYEEAISRGLKVVAVTSGGRLGEMATRDGMPVLVPQGLVPRAALGYLFTPLALIMEKAGLINGVSDDLKETVSVLRSLSRRLDPDAPAKDNISLALARSLYRSIPVIWGTCGVSEASAMRLKAQLNENAKVIAYVNLFPELNHNEIVGFAEPEEILENTVIVNLRHPDDHPRVRLRMKLTGDLVRSRVKDIIEIDAVGDSWLARQFSLIYIGDYASVYLAGLYNIDPLPVAVIERLKDDLKAASL